MSNFREIPKPGLIGTLHLSHNSYVIVSYVGEVDEGHSFQITLINVSNATRDTEWVYSVDFFKGLVKAYGKAMVMIAETYEEEKSNYIPSGGWDND